MEGLIEIGKLKRIQAVLNRYVNSKLSNRYYQFDWNTNLKFIQKGKGAFLPVKINSDLKNDKPKYVYLQRSYIENQLKIYFLVDYNLSKPK